MKRSVINWNIKETMALLERYNIKTPDFFRWTMKEWAEKKDRIDTIRQTGMGWDVTDYGTREFEKIGGVFLTLRNGCAKNPNIGTRYAEKLIILAPGQRLPIHMHKSKSEDIINVYCDGIEETVKAGETMVITAGNSITINPGCYHTFGCIDEKLPSIVGEVSSVNDDRTDNYFYEKVYPVETEEDEAAEFPLWNEYDLLG